MIKGDSLVAEISAASILAKVARDQEMIELDRRYPEYAFAQHKGYPTKLHLERLAQFGVLPEYRRSFAPVKKLLSTLLSKKSRVRFQNTKINIMLEPVIEYNENSVFKRK